MALDHDPIAPGSRWVTSNSALAVSASRLKLMCAIAVLFLCISCQNRDAEAQAEASTAVAMLEQNRLAEARIAINRALMLRDDVVDFHLTRGRIELAAGAISGAFDAYLDALALDGSNPEALQAVSQLGLQTGNIRESLKATDTLVLLSPANTNALVTRGVHALISSRLDQAEDYADRAMEVNPYSDDALVLKSRVLYLKGRNQEALDLLAQRSDDRKPSTGIYLMRLELYRAERDPDGMARQFEALHTDSARSWRWMTDEANFLFKVGRKDEALDLTTKVLVLPDLPREALKDVMNLWDVWGITGLPRQAVESIANQGQTFVRYGTAVFLARQSALPAAKRVAASLEGPDGEALRALISLLSGRSREANQIAGGILENDSSHCLALEVQARVNLATNQLRKALSRSQELAAQCPGERAGWIIAATAYTRLGDPENAERVLQQGAEANPQDYSYAVEQTQWLKGQGKDREAVAVARRLTRSAPAMTPGWELYRDVCADAGNNCSREAESGIADSLTRFWIDYKPGEAPPPGLFSRLKDL